MIVAVVAMGVSERPVVTPVALHAFAVRHRPGCASTPVDPLACDCTRYTTPVWSSLAWLAPGRCTAAHAPIAAHTAQDGPLQLSLLPTGGGR